MVQMFFSRIVKKPYEFSQICGETPESFAELFEMIRPMIQRHRNINLVNQFLMTLVWIRTYPTYATLSVLFDLPITTIHTIVHEIWPLILQQLGDEISWPSHAEWEEIREEGCILAGVVGAIDGTSFEIEIPEIDQQLYYSGHRKYHCFHCQVIIDNNKVIRYLHSGFQGHMNDAQCYRNMPAVGYNKEYHLPRDAWLLADSIYPAEAPLITPYRRNQIDFNDPHDVELKLDFNRVHRGQRVYIEHVIGEIKQSRIIHTIFRHPREIHSEIVHLCAVLGQRKINVFSDV